MLFALDLADNLECLLKEQMMNTELMLLLMVLALLLLED